MPTILWQMDWKTQDKRPGGHGRLCWVSSGEMTGHGSGDGERGWTAKMLGDGRQRV